MKYDYQRHLITTQSSIKEAMAKLNELASDAILFVSCAENKLLGSLTDGDVRRGLLNGLVVGDIVDLFTQPNPKFIQKGKYKIDEIIEFRENGYKVLPVVDQNNVIVNIINFRFLKSYLPIDAVIMAGGRGERLKPLTNTIPKPLLPVGGKPIIQHNIDRLQKFGIDNYWISIKYLGGLIKDHFNEGDNGGININYVNEESALGTIGAMSLIPKFEHDYILVTNSDVLTNLDYEDFFLDFIKSDADFSVATIPYDVNIPYAILETSNNIIKSFKEKPTYSYFANAGIYLMKTKISEKIPKAEFYNATDLLDYLIENGFKVTSYPFRGYWLDIGKHDDYRKAQEDINYIQFH